MGRGFVSPSGSIYAVTASVVSQIALYHNNDRTGIHFYNHTNGTVYVSYAATASLNLDNASWTQRLVPSSSFIDDRSRPYTGIVTTVWDQLLLGGTPTGNLMITELSLSTQGYNF